MFKKNTTQIVCIAQFIAQEGKLEELLQALYSLIGPTRKEEGCMRYELNQSIDNPNIITFVEKFKDQSAFDTHCNMPYITNYFNNIAPNLITSSSISLHHEII